MCIDNFQEAAARHFIDAEILFNESRIDNSLCHYAFSTECIIKATVQNLLPGTASIRRSIGHDITGTWDNISALIDLSETFDSESSVLLAQLTIPNLLFDNHPDRRYYADSSYTAEDIGDSKKSVGILFEKFLSYKIDGIL